MVAAGGQVFYALLIREGVFRRMIKENKGTPSSTWALWCEEVTGSRKGPTLLPFESPSSGGKTVRGAANNRHIKWWKTNRRIKTPRQTEVGRKVGWIPEGGGCVTRLLFCCVWGDKREREVQSSAMLVICSDSQPFYSHNYPQLSEQENQGDSQHQVNLWLVQQTTEVAWISISFFKARI